MELKLDRETFVGTILDLESNCIQRGKIEFGVRIRIGPRREFQICVQLNEL